MPYINFGSQSAVIIASIDDRMITYHMKTSFCFFTHPHSIIAPLFYVFLFINLVIGSHIAEWFWKNNQI